MKANKLKKAFRAAFPRTIPILTGYIFLGFGFGLLLQSRGYNAIWAVFMAITMFAGSMQYAAVDILASGASLIVAALLTLMINARHLFYGISLIGKYQNLRFAKPYLIFGLTDETYSLIVSGNEPEGVEPNLYYFAVTLLDHIYWICGCALGNIFGSLVPINTAGVEFSMTSLFIIILVDNLKKQQSRIPAICGVAVSFVCLLVFGPDNFLIPAMISITVVLLALRPVLGEKGAAHGVKEGSHA